MAGKISNPWVAVKDTTLSPPSYSSGASEQTMPFNGAMAAGAKPGSVATPAPTPSSSPTPTPTATPVPAVPVEVEPSAGAQYQETLPAPASSWVLTRVPKLPSESRLYVNGQKQIYGLDYLVDGLILYWIGDYTLPAGWHVEIYYQ